MPPVNRTLLIFVVILLTGCVNEAPAKPNKQNQTQEIAVDGAIAKLQTFDNSLNYTGTTEPIKEVSLRAQVEGKLLNVNVDVGDEVKQGQTLAQIDDSLLQTLTNQVRAELATTEAELVRAKTQVKEAQARVALVQAQLQQAQADAQRLQKLSQQGAIAAQQAETAQTNLLTTQQQLESAKEQVNTQLQAVTAANSRVKAQQAILAQALKRQSYSVLKSPINGVVLKRTTDPGNLIQPGGEVLTLGDFSKLKVVVQLSELSLNQVKVGQEVEVRLDAYPDRLFQGNISRISPVADAVSRLVPIEIVIPNDGSIAGGLLARVNFLVATTQRVMVPESAVKDNTIFVIEKTQDNYRVISRTVTLGDRRDGLVQVLSGLAPGEQFVSNSAQPLKEGDLIRKSIISEQ